MDRIVKLQSASFHKGGFVISVDGRWWIHILTGKRYLVVSGGIDMFDPDFVNFRFYDDDAGEAASAPLEAQDIDHTLTVDTDQAIQFRALIQNQMAADGTTMDDYGIEYDKNGAGPVSLTTTDTGTGIRAVAAGLTNDNATTDRSTNGITGGSGTFVAGEQSSDGIVDDMQLTSSNYTHHAYGVEFVSTNVANNDTFDFTFTGSSGVTNTATPRITISKAAPAGGPSKGSLSMMGMGV